MHGKYDTWFFGWLVDALHLHSVLLKTQAKMREKCMKCLKQLRVVILVPTWKLVDFEHSGIFPQIAQIKMWR